MCADRLLTAALPTRTHTFSTTLRFCRELRVAMASAEHAQIAADTLSVDEELQKDKAQRTVTADGKDVVM